MLANLFRIAVVLALPVACLIWAGHLGTDGADKLDGKSFNALCVIQQLVAPGRPPDCLAKDWLWVFEIAALIALAISLTPVLLFLGSAFLCGAKRWLNAAVFPRMIPTAITLIVLTVIAQGLLLVLAATAFYLTYLGNPPIIVLFFAVIGIFGVAGAVIAGATSVDLDGGFPVTAVNISQKEAPEVWALVGEIAEAMEAEPPENIVIGFEMNFWVVSGRVDLVTPGRTERIDGQTLFLSLPAMHVLSQDELVGIIGHELGHFRGRDLAYSERFLPVYNALAGARYELEVHRDVATSRPIIAEILSSASKIPARMLLSMLGAAFHRNTRRIDRIREFEADAAATEVAEPRACVTALLKVALYREVWEDMIDEHARRISKTMPRAAALARHFDDLARLDVTKDDAEQMLVRALRARLSHPYDTHPTTSARAKALGIKPASLGADDLRVALDAPSMVDILLPRPVIEEIEAVMLTAEHERLKAQHLIADAPGMQRNRKVDPLYHDVYSLLAALVRAAPDPAERFGAASALGEEEMTDFDVILFAEYVRGRREAEDPQDAAVHLGRLAGPEAADLMAGITGALLGPEDHEIQSWIAAALQHGAAASSHAHGA